MSPAEENVPDADQKQSVPAHVLAACQGKITATINRLSRAGNYNSGRYVQRHDIENEFKTFVKDGAPCFLLLGRSGSGKTYLMARLAELYAATHPTLYFLSRDIKTSKEYAFADQIGDEFAEILGHSPSEWPESANLLNEALKQYGEPILVFIDGINESADTKRLNQSLKRAIRAYEERGLEVRFCISCRTDVWYAEFDDPDWRAYAYQPPSDTVSQYQFATTAKQPTAPVAQDAQAANAPHEPESKHGIGVRISDFNDEELDKAIRQYDMRCTFVGTARDVCKYPILFRIFSDCFPDSSGEIESIASRRLFEAYWDQKLEELKRADKTKDFEAVLNPVLATLSESKSLTVSLADVEKWAKANGVEVRKDEFRPLQRAEILFIDYSPERSETLLGVYPDIFLHYLLAKKFVEDHFWESKNEEEIQKDFREFASISRLRSPHEETIVQLILHAESMSKDSTALLKYLLDCAENSDHFDKDPYLSVVCKTIIQMEKPSSRKTLSTMDRLLALTESQWNFFLGDQIELYSQALARVLRGLPFDESSQFIASLCKQRQRASRAALVDAILDIMLEKPAPGQALMESLWAPLPEKLWLWSFDDSPYEDIKDTLMRCMVRRAAESIARYENVIRILASSENVDIRVAVAYLAGRGSTSRRAFAMDILNTCASDACSDVRVAAARALSIPFSNNVSEAWDIAAELLADADPTVRQTAIMTLGELSLNGFERSLSLVRTSATHPDPTTRMACALAAANWLRSGAIAAKVVLLNLIHDPNVRVRISALRASLKKSDTFDLMSTGRSPRLTSDNERDLLGLSDDEDHFSMFEEDQPSHITPDVLIELMEAALTDEFQEIPILCVIGCQFTLEDYPERTKGILMTISSFGETHLDTYLTEYCDRYAKSLGLDAVSAILGPQHPEMVGPIERRLRAGTYGISGKTLAVVGLAATVGQLLSLAGSQIFAYSHLLASMFVLESDGAHVTSSGMIVYSLLVATTMHVLVVQLERVRIVPPLIGCGVAAVVMIPVAYILGNAWDIAAACVIAATAGPYFGHLYDEGTTHGWKVVGGRALFTIFVGLGAGALAGAVPIPATRFGLGMLGSLAIGMLIYYWFRLNDDTQSQASWILPAGAGVGLAIWATHTVITFLISDAKFLHWAVNVTWPVASSQISAISVAVVVALGVVVVFARAEWEVENIVLFAICGAALGATGAFLLAGWPAAILSGILGATIFSLLYLVFYSFSNLRHSFAFRNSCAWWLPIAFCVPAILATVAYFASAAVWNRVFTVHLEQTTSILPEMLGWLATFSVFAGGITIHFANDEMEWPMVLAFYVVGAAYTSFLGWVGGGFSLAVFVALATFGATGCLAMLFYGLSSSFERNWLWIAIFTLCGSLIVIFGNRLLHGALGSGLAGSSVCLAVLLFHSRYHVLGTHLFDEEEHLSLERL